MSYKHITSFQRNELSGMLQVKANKKDIAKVLNKHRSTIWRELKRNYINNKSGYDAGIAKENTKNKRIKANFRFKKIENNVWIQNYIIEKIILYWSPEQISGRLKIDYPYEKNKQISKDSIYKFIYEKRKDLVKYLRCQKGKYRRHYGTRIREKQREDSKKKRIDQRPKEIETKERIGDWEGDTIVGKDKSHILTHVERKSGLLKARKLKRGTSEITKIETIKTFKEIRKDKKYTITYDNGVTFSDHKETERITGIDIYFAYPYHSWERGCNENCNGLLRQFFPKKS
ncbi:IS30 family transposase, partial [Patescibacteria group bacterium]|nr:IS30 family transposase [Patescibacteria group bacterium]